MMTRLMLIAGLLLAGAVSLQAQETRSAGSGPAPPTRLASIDRGRILAQRMCADCHAIEPGRRTSPNAEAPSFQAIADTRGMGIGALRVFFETPHRKMPNLIVERADADDIIDYILNLKSP
jgi:mono/diheme cytochrome c family protein